MSIKFPSKRLIISGAVAWLIATTGAIVTRHPSNPFEKVAFAQGQAAQARPQMSETAFKNVTVLKGIPVDEFMGTMGLFAAALAVCCGDCHTGAGTDHPDWAADPPRKIMARKMIQMVNTINKENFNGRQVVTCWTCHRGSESPATTPPLDTIYTETPLVTPPDVLPAANPATSGTPPADQILSKYIQALGGADKLAALKSYTAKGTSNLFGETHTDPFELYAKAPNQLAIIVHQKEGDLARAYDGRDAWVMLPLTVVGEYPLSASAKEGAKLDAEMAFPGELRQGLPNWRVSYPVTIHDEDVYVVQGTDANRLIVATFYFDRKTGLLSRMIHYANSAMGRVPTQIDYSDYRPVGGVMMPFKWTYGWVSGREEYVVTDYQPNAPVDRAKFGRPVQRAK
jgi:photosynthetic reaction center cytochrome c subunit